MEKECVFVSTVQVVCRFRATTRAWCISLLIAGCSAQQPKPEPAHEPPAVQQAAAVQALPPPPPPLGADAGTPGFPTLDGEKDTALTYRIIDAPNNTFGYEILNEGRLFVHQTNVPGIAGIEGCKTRSDAEKIAALVIAKIRAGETPPVYPPRI